MIGIVVVSHSARLAEGVVELARGMAGPDVPIEAAGGIDEPGELGTDAVRVMEAIERAGGDGTLVLMDLGSAVLSAETALDLLPDDVRARVLLCEAPLVEGAVAAAAAARAGGTLDDVAREARGGLAGKQAHLGSDAAAPATGDAPAADDDGEPWTSAEATVGGAHGLHARPAAAVVRAAADSGAEVRMRNLTTGRGPASARSLTGLSTLGALEGHRVAIEARGPGADAAIATIRALVEGGDAPPAAAADAAPEAGTAPAAAPVAAARGELQGVAAAPGRGAGPARMRARAPDDLPERTEASPEQERAALHDALARAGGELDELRTRAAPETADILGAQMLLVDDAGLRDPAEAAIDAGTPAARAYDEAARAVAAAYDAIDDPYMRVRRDDVLDLGRRVVAILTGTDDRRDAPGVLVADDLGAAEVAAIDPARVAAIVTAGGGATSHASIIARSLGVPAVAGAGPGVLGIAEGTTLLVDGDAGTVVVDPDPDALARHEARARDDAAAAEVARAHADEPATTRDGRRIEVAANAGAPGDLDAAAASGADGIGLLRTEFLFLGPPGRPRRGRAARGLRGRRRRARRAPPGAAHPRRRRRQAAALPRDGPRGEPVPRRARAAPLARAPRRAAYPAARGPARGRRRAGVDHVPDGQRAARAAPGDRDPRRGPRRAGGATASTPARSRSAPWSRCPRSPCWPGRSPPRSTSCRSGPTTSPSTRWPPSGAAAPWPGSPTRCIRRSCA